MKLLRSVLGKWLQSGCFNLEFKKCLEWSSVALWHSNLRKVEEATRFFLMTPLVFFILRQIYQKVLHIGDVLPASLS